MAAMLDLEEHLRAVTADVIAESFGIDNNEYLKWNHYRDRKVTRDRFSLKKVSLAPCSKMFIQTRIQ